MLGLGHDVDTNNRKGVRLLVRLEREFGVAATYYSRLKTLETTDIVREILEYGSEIGYHFEEPATLAKRDGITWCRELEKKEHRKRIDEMMERKIQDFNAQLGIQIKSLCSHNGFSNRRLEVENHAFLSVSVRHEFNILLETYDPSVVALVDECVYDVADDACLWHDDRSPVEAMLDGVPKIRSHPRTSMVSGSNLEYTGEYAKAVSGVVLPIAGLSM